MSEGETPHPDGIPVPERDDQRRRSGAEEGGATSASRQDSEIGGSTPPVFIYHQHQHSVTNITANTIGQLSIQDKAEGPTTTIKREASEVESSSPSIDPEWVFISPTIKFHRKKPLCRNAEVYYAEQDLTGYSRKLAVKLVKKTDRSAREAGFLAKLESHRNIVSIYDSAKCENYPLPYIYIAMELCRQNLDDYIKKNPFNLPKATSFFHQTSSAIAFIHDKDIAHRDLKPSNILIAFDGETIKVSDFGVSKDTSPPSTDSNPTAGTEGFKAPETYKTTTKHDSMDKADIFSLGINGYYIYTHGKHPFGPNHYKWPAYIVDNKHRSLSQIPSFPQSDTHKRPQLIKLLKHMLQYDPLDRPTAQEILDNVFFHDGTGDAADEFSSSEQEKAQKKIAEYLQSCGVGLQENDAKALSESLIQAESDVKRGEEENVVDNVKSSIPKSNSAEDVKKMAKKLEEKDHSVSAIIMYRVSVVTYSSETEDRGNWIRDRVSDTRCAIEQLMESEYDCNKAINVGLRFMNEMLRELRSLTHASDDVRARSEASCIVSISRISIDAGDRPNAVPHQDIIPLCKEGLDGLEKYLGTKVVEQKLYGYLLNNIGEAHMQLGQFKDAEKHFEKSLEVKNAAITYESKNMKRKDIKMTQQNLDKCRQRQIN